MSRHGCHTSRRGLRRGQLETSWWAPRKHNQEMEERYGDSLFLLPGTPQPTLPCYPSSHSPNKSLCPHGQRSSSQEVQVKVLPCWASTKPKEVQKGQSGHGLIQLKVPAYGSLSPGRLPSPLASLAATPAATRSWLPCCRP